MRIALTATFAWPEVRRGGERYLHELAAALARRGHDVTVTATSPTPGRSRQLGVDVTLLPRRPWTRFLGPFWGPQVWFGIDARRHLRSAPPDVWHAFTLGDAAAATTLEGTTSVYTLLGPEPLVRDVPWLVARLHGRILRSVDAYLSLSHAVRRRVEETTGRRSLVVGGGVDTSRFRPVADRDDRPTILFASDVGEHWKNGDLFLDACAILRERVPDLQVWFTGSGDIPRLLARHPDAADLVVRDTQSPPEQLVDDYSRAWVTALPSRGEAFGLVALESLACGTPAVGLVDEGPADFLDATVGGLSEPTATSLAGTLQAALEQSTNTDTVERCRERARLHDWNESVAPRVEQVYVEASR